jgi:hypothetical protein
MLFHPNGFSENWITPKGGQGQSFYFRWPPGRTAVQAVQVMHNPEVCLSSIGMHLRRKLQPVTVSVAGNPVTFQSWCFEQNAKDVIVYNAVVLGGLKGVTNEEALDDSPLGRLNRLVRGLRNHGQRMVEIAFWNLPDQLSARQALEAYLSGAVVLRNPPPKQ